MVNFEFGYMVGLIGFGVDVLLYVGLKFDGGVGVGNMVYVVKGGGGLN